MKRKPSRLITTKGKYMVLTFTSLIMFYLFSYMINPYDSWWRNYFSRPFTELAEEWAVSLIFCLLISGSSLLIHQKLNKSLPWIERPLLRLLIEIVLTVAYVVLLIFIQMFLFSMITESNTITSDDTEQVEGYWQWVSVSIFIALAIGAVHTGDYLITNWKNAALEATEHKLKSAQNRQAAAEAELQALRLQLDPHFVFNNLSVLSELILEDQQLGYHYSENFSKVYRYLLLYSNKDLISLEEELKFLKAYVFLLEHRAGSGIAFEIDVQPSHMNLQLPPLTLQLLIENAMKHNKLLKSNPLRIKIRSGNNMELTISNSLIPLDKPGLSSGLGLKNIVQRYGLLCDRTPVIETNENEFAVTIPLLKG